MEDDIAKGGNTKYSLNFANLQQATDKKRDYYAATYKVESNLLDRDEKSDDDSSSSEDDAYDAEKAEQQELDDQYDDFGGDDSFGTDEDM